MVVGKANLKKIAPTNYQHVAWSNFPEPKRSALGPPLLCPHHLFTICVALLTG